MSEPSDVRSVAKTLLRDLESIDRQINACQPQPTLYPDLQSAIDQCLSHLATLNLWGPANQLPSSELWNAAGHLLSRGWLQERAHSKPRGYAGDYEMLVRIYENRFCDDPLGQLFDRYFQSQAAPQAVRNRMRMIADWIVHAVNLQLTTHHSPPTPPVTTHHAFRIAIVGSAFGLEIRDALLRLDESACSHISVSLVDVDPAAIEFAETHLRHLLGDRLQTAATNLFRLPDRPKSAAILNGADWIFCPGLFDYLDDAAAITMVQTLFAQLAPRGRLTIFQFAPHNPTRTYMEWFGNWYLTYRDAESFSRLITGAVPPEAYLQCDCEPLGIDLCATTRRP